MTKHDTRSLVMISFDAVFGGSEAPTMHTLKLAHGLYKCGLRMSIIMNGSKDETHEQNGLTIQEVKKVVASGLFGRGVAIVRTNRQFYKAAAGYSTTGCAVYERHNVLSTAGYRLAKKRNIPLFYEVNSISSEELLSSVGMHGRLVNAFFNWVMSHQLKRARAIFVQTDELKRLVGEKFAIRNVFVVPNGADKPDDVRAKTLAEKPVRLVYVGSLDQYHDITDILDTVAAHPGIMEITVVGSGEQIADYKEAYTQVGNITFVGRIPHDRVKQYLKRAHIGVACYDLSAPQFKRYGFYFCPIKLAEYAAYGLPSVAVGCSNSFIERLVTAGACHATDEAAGLLVIVDGYLEDHKTFEVSSRAALAISRSMTWDAIARATLSILEESIA